MHIVIYADTANPAYQRLNHAIESLKWNRPPEYYSEAERFCDRFRSNIDYPDVIIIMPDSAEELDALIRCRDLFENIRTIVILPEREHTLLSKGHQFHPSFMAFHDDDFGMLTAILDHVDKKIGPVAASAPAPIPAVDATVTAGPRQVLRFASFLIDRERGAELALDAEAVLEATTISGIIQPLPAGVDFLEGFMHLRDDTIPVINLKKRLGLVPADYAPDAKVAVVGLSGFRFGLLFDDIKDVLLVPADMIDPIHPALLTNMSLITDLIKLDNGRSLQLLDLQRLFGDLQFALEYSGKHSVGDGTAERHRDYRRFVVFAIGKQHYGMRVEHTQEITFLSDIDRTFKNDIVEGSLDLRGRYIPVINSAYLLQQTADEWQTGADTRVLVVDADEYQYGLIVDRICEIICIADDEVMRLPRTDHSAVEGIFQHADGRSIMLIELSRLIGDRHQQLKSLARLKSRTAAEASQKTGAGTRHLITAECYLIFSIGRNFAVELNDVQEIIEPVDLMDLPGRTGVDRRVLNLRGTVIPVVDLRLFYGYERAALTENSKLIIARKDDRMIAIEVDQILTIYKQVQFQRTPSLNPRFSGKQDTLDRLIEFVDDTGIKEHVLVLNVDAMMRNHLGLFSLQDNIPDQLTAKENKHGISTAQPSGKAL